MSALTRLLYAEDEIIASLISCLIKKRDIRECYFWISELYNSEIDVFQIIWQIYYDFYADINNNIDNYIQRKEKTWRKKRDFRQIAHIIRNLFHLKTTGTVFQLRHYILTNGPPTSIYRGRRPQWLTKFDKKYHNLLLSIYKKNYTNIAHHLSKLLMDSEDVDIFIVLMKYYESEYGPCDLEGAIEYWKNHFYKDKKHMLLGLIIHMMRKEYKIVEKFIQAKERDMDWIEYLELEAGFVYDNLKKRCFSIDEKMGGFELGRFILSNYVKEYERNWEYYANKNSMWNRRCNAFSASFNNNEIKFPNDDKLEEFYEKYSYEPDEQPKSIREKALIYIEKITHENLYEDLFGAKSEILLPENYRYIIKN